MWYNSTMTLEFFGETLAQIIVDALNIQRGQNLAIRCEPALASIVPVIAKYAYRKGARYVDYLPAFEALKRSRIDNSPHEYLGYFPGYVSRIDEDLVSGEWVYLAIKSPDDPAIMNGAAADRLAVVEKAHSEARHLFRTAFSENRSQWLVVAVPSLPWARHVLGNIPDVEERFTEVLGKLYRLNEDNPSLFWTNYARELSDRAHRLTKSRITKLRFVADGTDLAIKLPRHAIWRGGLAHSADGMEFLPNIPTEEVFTAPHADGTDGTVRITRPVMVYGGTVSEATLTFADGEVVQSSARKGADLLSAYLNVEEGNRRLGEVALVDSGSPIFQSGLMFSNTLLDENAACHIALGFAYPDCVEGGIDMSMEERREKGLNTGRDHLDVMIGDESLTVTAELENGETMELMRSGRFSE